ncbi:hypothetical protein [Sulfurovum sp. NBC37-1]|uniref:hypothetical protein n=1 Tax=Sulfurovum sp. (strain NBC37-1) TaxID=387093 RepID=UPI0001587458|nr:hypothetical protein [Sulfurovum sp. NBC37-1]BAF71121.1 hypothetical protein SUN_0161 [Sulfurovum sp. NBC37-1]
MQYYNDEQNAKGVYFAFVMLQVFMLLIVYSFVYTSLVGAKLAIVKYHLTSIAYLPVVFVMFAYPMVLYKTRRMFREHKRLRATGWMLGWAVVAIVFLYAFLSQLIAV